MTIRNLVWNIFVPFSIATIELSLRRTLVL